jgi:hypothetical protein
MIPGLAESNTILAAPSAAERDSNLPSFRIDAAAVM